MSMPYFGRPIPFDMPFVGQHGDEGVFTQEITSCAERLGASHKEKTAAQSLSAKIKTKLDQLVTNPELLEAFKIEDVYEVGSVKTDTALAGHCVADITIITSCLPFQEMMESLSTYLIGSFGDECISCYPTEYGCLVTTTEAQARLLITITPNNVSELEPGLHLDADLMRIAYQAVRQTQYIEGLSHQTIPLKELIRVVKDVRRRFPGLHHLNIWALQYLCYFSLLKEPGRIPLPLGPAFRRFFQLLSAGVFLPNAAPMFDPAEPSRPLGSDLTYEQQDELCATSQTILRLICNKGQSIVLGVSRLGSDVTKQDTHLTNVIIRPSRPTYCEEDMKPKFCEEDLKMLSVKE